MISRAHRPPKTERSFANIWGELNYLCKKVRYWLYLRHEKPRAVRYLNRLKRVLEALPKNNIAILREEGWSLFYEIRGKLGDAIAHREREIKLMERLHEEAKYPNYAEFTRQYMLRDRDTKVLAERRAILDALKKEAGGQRIEAHRKAQ